jgi:hypothetical protein
MTMQRTEGEGKEPERTHAARTHSHDYSQADEEQEHGKRAHVHDHAAPTHSPG